MRYSRAVLITGLLVVLLGLWFFYSGGFMHGDG